MEGDAREFKDLPWEGAYFVVRVPGAPLRYVPLVDVYQRFKARMEAERKEEESAAERRHMDIVMKMPRRKEKL